MFVQGSAFKGNLRWPESFQSKYWQVNDTIANFMGLGRVQGGSARVMASVCDLPARNIKTCWCYDEF